MNFQELIDQLFANSWRAGILIAALFAFRGVLRRFLDARVIYWFWVIVAVRLLLPFDVPVSVSAARYLPLAPWTYAGDFDAGPSVSTSEPVVPGSVAPPAAASLREILLNEKTLAIVWAVGVATVLLAYFWASLSFRRQLSRSGRRAGKRTEQAVSSCSRAMGLNPITVLEMDALSGPALFGVWRPRLLFPLGLADQLSDEELRLVVLHELGHLKRRDLFLQGLLVVSQAVHWFNPLVWLAGRLAREDRELACDEFVMAHTSHSGSHAYAKTLLRVLGLSRPGRSMLPAVGILETKNQIKQRIIMITKYQSTNARRLMLGAASILAVSVGLLMVNAAESGSNASTPAAAAATETAAPAMPNKISITPKNKNTFKNGDGIEIKEVLGSVPNFQVGGTYRVKGICRQQTLDSAQLYMGNTILVRTGEGDFGQNAIIPVGATSLYPSISKGSTEFEYVFKLLRPGMLHITIYDMENDNAYAGIYLGETFDSDAAKAPGSNNGRNPKAAIGDPKAGKIIIPKINFTDVSVEKALEFLRAKSRELDPEEKGVEITLKDSQKSKDSVIALSMDYMPLFDAVKYVGEAANLDVNWVGKAIVLTSRSDVKSSEGSTENSESSKKE